MSDNSFLKGLKAKYPVMTLDDAPQKIEAIPTGSLALDHALGIGGVPRGRITEIFGPDGSGKTTLVYSILAQAQETEPGWVLYMDVEHRGDLLYMQAVGVKADKLVISQPGSGESALEIVEKSLETKGFSAIAVDSVAALVPKAELEGDMGDIHVALQARLMSHALRKLSDIRRKSGTALIFTNQVRTNVGVLYGNPEVTSGGKALKYYADIRLRVSSTTPMTQAEASGRTTIKAVVRKNSCAPPYKRTEFDIVFGKGIDRVSDLFNVLKATKVIEARGAYFFQGDENIGHKNDVLEAIEQDFGKWAEFAQIGEAK